MTTDLKARVRIDDRFRKALTETNKRLALAEIANGLTKKGSPVSRSALKNMKTRSASRIKTVSYQLYTELVGEEPEQTVWEESPHAARRVAYWLCFFFNVGKTELAREVCEEAEAQGASYAEKAMM